MGPSGITEVDNQPDSARRQAARRAAALGHELNSTWETIGPSIIRTVCTKCGLAATIYYGPEVLGTMMTERCRGEPRS